MAEESRPDPVARVLDALGDGEFVCDALMRQVSALRANADALRCIQSEKLGDAAALCEEEANRLFRICNELAFAGDARAVFKSGYYRLLGLQPIGWQIVATETDDPPEGMTTYEVYSLAFVVEWFAGLKEHDKSLWRCVPIFEGDVQEPRMMG